MNEREPYFLGGVDGLGLAPGLGLTVSPEDAKLLVPVPTVSPSPGASPRPSTPPKK